MEIKTLTITNFGGPLTRRSDGNIDSGLAKFDTSWGYDPYSKPGNLTWMEQPTSILTGTGVMAMKQRTESGLNYVYAVATNNNVYKITVNSATNPNVDSTAVVGSVVADTYTAGGGMTFYGATEKVFLGGDRNIQKIGFDGSAASVIGSSSADYPRPFAKFIGKVYFGNGNNIGEIDSTETVTSAGKLSPALPSGLFVKDLDITPDGNYLQIIASSTNPLSALGGQPDGDLSSFNSADSYKFYWDGIGSSYSASEDYSGLVLSANVAYGNENYSFGYDSTGTAIFSGAKKVVSLPETLNPLPNAAFSVGDRIGFVAPEYELSSTRFKTAIYNYGQYDNETPLGLFRLLRQRAQVGDDISTVAACINVSSRMHLPQSFEFANNLAGAGKIYYSNLELSSAAGSGTVATKLWRFPTVPTGTGSIVAGVYETQTQLFSKKVAIKEVRLYTDPLAADNAFEIDLIGSGGSVLSGGSRAFAVGTNVTSGEDLVRYNPSAAPTYALGVRITNASVTGTRNWTATKLEVDFTDAGK